MISEVLLWIGGVVVTIIGALIGCAWYLAVAFWHLNEQKHSKEFTTIEGGMQEIRASVKELATELRGAYVTKEQFQREMGRQNDDLREIKDSLRNKASRDDLPAMRGPLPSRPR